MNRTLKIIVIVAAAVLVIGGISTARQRAADVPPPKPVSVAAQKAGMVPYANSTYGLSFSYPSNLHLTERTDAGTPARPQLALLLMDGTHAAPEAGEGPTSIAIDAYQNSERLSATEWMAHDTNWTVANGSPTTVQVAGTEAASFGWSGLYEGRSVVVTKGDKAYVLAVTWMTSEDQILRDFQMILDSLVLDDEAADLGAWSPPCCKPSAPDSAD